MALPIKTLDAKHPEFNPEALAEFDALYEGGCDARALMRNWIPQHEQEPDARYNRRIARAGYDNHVGPMVDLIGAWMFSKPPTVEGIDADWLANVDGQGRNLSLWIREVVTDAMQFRTAYVWVNLPRRPENVDIKTRADEERLGLHRPFLVNIEAEDVRRWWNDPKGNLRALLFRQDIEEDEGIESAPRKIRQWTYIDATQIRRWKASWKDGNAPLDTDSAEEEPAIPHGMGRMPVARICLPAGLHVLGKLRDPAVALLRLENDYDWRLHVDAHNLLVIKTADVAQKPTLGAGYALIIGPNDAADYIAPDGTVYGAFENRINDRRENLYRVVQQMAQGVAGKGQAQAASAASKAMDWQSLQVMLAAYAEYVRGLIRQVCELVALPLTGKPAAFATMLRRPNGESMAVTEGIKVGGLEGWHEDELKDVLEAALIAGPLTKSETFKKLQAREIVRRMLPSNTDQQTRDKINDEIEAADFSEIDVFAGPPVKPGPPAVEDDPTKAAA